MYIYADIHIYTSKNLLDLVGKKNFLPSNLNFFSSANILLDKDFTAKISDFGLARASAKFAQTVMTSRIVGTTAYMAPEALRGEITPKSDIYSFGVVRDHSLYWFALISLECVCMHVAQYTHAKSQRAACRSRFSPSTILVPRGQTQAWRQVPLIAEPSFQPMIILLKW